ncbi:CehA/McbA family metallohydrolase [Bosea sp. UC22_33]|uniref:CehA/McbA family metallohydrolase n=1 Tax=Bosea sp. UC22_33 TaxID=3350165 RepID=UPI00366A9369
MQVEAFTAPGRFYRGNLHTHSTRSDGKLTPEEVCKRYRERGYDFICLSDHFMEHYDYPIVDTTDYRTDRFTTILGAECHAPATERGEKWHILAVGLPLDFPPNRDGETGAQLAQRCLDAGAFVAIPHPEWYGLTAGDAASIPGAHAVEVYNHTSQVLNGRGGGSYYLDDILNTGRRIGALACDDAHWVVEADRNRDAFGGWVMVKAEANEPQALVDALKQGRYYSSQGPLIENVVVDGDFVEIACSPAFQVSLVGRASKNEKISGLGTTSARLPWRKFEGDWCRLVVIDEAGKIAWSNPIYF